MSENRPNPDELLAKIHQTEQKSTKGKLKIFFGYAAGVGKTYSMLKAAHGAKRRGVDVIVGYIEPHSRPETAASKGAGRMASRSTPRRGSANPMTASCAAISRPRVHRAGR